MEGLCYRLLPSTPGARVACCVVAGVPGLTQGGRSWWQLFVVNVDEDTPLFVNSAINRASRVTDLGVGVALTCGALTSRSSSRRTGKLNLEARRVVLSALVDDGARPKFACVTGCVVRRAEGLRARRPCCVGRDAASAASAATAAATMYCALAEPAGVGLVHLRMGA